MNYISALIDACFHVLNITINLFGFGVTLWQVFLFCALVYILVYIFFGIMK